MSTAKLYAPASLPDCWVAEHEGVLVMWPARDGGWRERQPYRGHKRALREVPPYSAAGTGWPGVPVGRPPSVGADGKQLIRGPQALLDAMTERARRDGVSASELWREAARRLLQNP